MIHGIFGDAPVRDATLDDIDLDLTINQLLCAFSREIIVLSYAGIHKDEHMAIYFTALGQRIADFRNKEILSQEELAFNCGVGSKHISNIELGKSKPSLESLIQIDYSGALLDRNIQDTAIF